MTKAIPANDMVVMGGEEGYLVNVRYAKNRSEAARTLIEEETGGLPTIGGLLSVARSIHKRPQVMFHHEDSPEFGEYCHCENFEWICGDGDGEWAGEWWWADTSMLEEALWVGSKPCPACNGDSKVRNCATCNGEGAIARKIGTCK